MRKEIELREMAEEVLWRLQGRICLVEFLQMPWYTDGRPRLDGVLSLLAKTKTDEEGRAERTEQ